jgi:cathepsin L
MKTLCVASAFLGATLAQDLPTFESFIETHSRSYKRGSVEYQDRNALYQQRVADAKVHNGLPGRTWKAGVNKLWDWTENELQSLRGWDGAMMPEGHRPSRSIARHGSFLQQPLDLPKEKIYSNLQTFSYTKNQADCGSCWAIASSTVLEAHNEIYNGNHKVFSTQQIVDCTPNPRHCGGDGGCKGATAELAMDWVLKNGLADASELPYTGRGGVCTRGSPTADMKAVFLDSSPKSGGEAFGMMSWSTLPKK